jgi:PTH2 family peptidyl-tRNA hydrolase
MKKSPIIMYLIVRSSLNMTAGKIAAQCCHATRLLMERRLYMSAFKSLFNTMSRPSSELYTTKMTDALSIFDSWSDDGMYRTVVLSANDKEFEKIKLEYNDDIFVQTDFGLTQLEPNTETVIALWPQRKDKASKTIKRLQIVR